MVGPGLTPRPGAPLQVPGEGVVFQQVHILLAQPGEAGFQTAEQIVIPVAPRHRIQGGGDEGQDGLFQNVAHAAEEHRHPVALQHRLQQGAVPLQVTGTDGNLPEAEALLPHQPQNLRRHPLHLGIEGVGGKEGEFSPALFQRGGPGGEELLFQMGQGGGFSRLVPGEHLHLGGDVPVLSQPQQLPGGAPGRGENARAPLVLLQLVAGEGHRHRFPLVQ